MPNDSKDSRILERPSSLISCGPLTPSKENCRIYEEESWWLPDAYVRNATCACNETSDSPEMNCIRGYLQEQLATIDADFKLRGYRLKKELSPISPEDVLFMSFGSSTDADPAAFLYPSVMDPKAVQKRDAYLRELTDLIYAHHVLAYQVCGCGSGPAWRWTWTLVTKFGTPWCGFIDGSIAVAGQCNPKETK